MEVEEIQTQGCKFPRISNGNGRIDSGKIGADDEDDCRDAKRHGSVGGVGGGGIDLSGGGSGGIGRLCGWPSSRIFRVSRASGGKDRHSKVWTSKGLRDRRVRLSVNTAIQFYDLQDRLGYDQPSKAVEWLLKAAAPSISDLPSLNAFPDTQQLSDDKRSSAGTAEPGFDSAEVEMDGDPNYHQQQQQHQQQQHASLSKSACSSTSETSKGSGLSLSRSESRVKARERARGRAAEKEKEKENDSTRVVHQQNNSHLISPNSSFTELLTGGMNSNNNNNNNNSPSSVHQNAAKSARQWPSSPFDYFTSGLLGPSTTRGNENTPNCYPGQIHLGSSLQPQLTSVSSPMFSITGDHHHHHHPELQHFPFVNEHLVVPVVAAPGGTNGHNNSTNEYNLNFSISSSSSSGFAGFNRGTLQSNSTSSSLLPHSIQRFSPMEGSSQSFFNGGTTAASVDNNNHHFLSAYDARLQLFYGDGHESRHSPDQKGKGKN